MSNCIFWLNQPVNGFLSKEIKKIPYFGDSLGFA